MKGFVQCSPRFRASGENRTDRQIDRRTNERTDGQTNRQTDQTGT